MENTLPQQNQTPVSPVLQSRSSKIPWIIGGIVGLIIVAGVVFFYFRNLAILDNAQHLNQESISKSLTTESPTPTPFQFEELTIPFLRKRKYKSNLGSLDQVSSGTYITYLTSYKSDGLKVNGFLTIPNMREPEGGWSAVIFIHGYIPPSQYITQGQSYADYVDHLARNGFVVFKIDLRGHGESEGQPGGGYFGADYVIDALNARAALAASDFVNPNKIGFWGHSMAGNILLRSFAVKPDIPAIVIWAGAVYSYEDREKYGIQDSSFQPLTNPTGVSRRRKIIDVHGEARSGSEFWKQMAPTYFLQDLRGAIEVHHAVDDDVVSINYSRDLMKEFDKTSVPHTLYEYSSGKHNIIGESFVQAMERTVAFFKKYLK